MAWNPTFYARLGCLAALASVLVACGAEPPVTSDGTPSGDAAVSTDAQAPATDDAPRAAADVPTQHTADAGAVPSDHPLGADASAPPPSCAAAPELIAPTNGSRDGRAFTLRGVTSRYSTSPQGCFWGAGSAVTARFVSPVGARWRLGARSASNGYFSAHDGCRGDAPGERLRCESTRVAPGSPLEAPSVSTAMTLRAGQAITLVLNCSSGTMECAADLFAEQIPDRGCFETDTPCEAGDACVWVYENNASRGRCVPGTAPSLRDVRVFNVGVMTATVTDPDGDHRQVFAELLDARGAIILQRGSPSFEGELQSLGRSIAVRLAIGRGYTFPAEALRARVWLRDGAGLESERVEVPVEAPTLLPAGAACVIHTSDPLTQIAACGPGTRCLGGESAPRCLPQTAPAVTRVAAWFDPVERAMVVDIDASDPDHDISTAEIVFLDAQGSELPGQSFSPYSSRRGLLTRREGVFGLDERGVPNGTARVRLRTGDSFGLWSAWSEVTPTPSTVVETGGRCDPESTARMRCESGVAYCVPRVGDAFGRCERPDPSCPRYWNAARWALPATAGTYSVTGSALTWSTPSVTCMASRDRNGVEYEFVAPVSGSYRFVLEGPPGVTHYSLALRDACGGPELVSELACGAANGAAGRAELVRTLTAGDAVMIVVSSAGAGLQHRLSVTVP